MYMYLGHLWNVRWLLKLELIAKLGYRGQVGPGFFIWDFSLGGGVDFSVLAWSWVGGWTPSHLQVGIVA